MTSRNKLRWKGQVAQTRIKSGFFLVVHMRLSSKEQKFLQKKPYKAFNRFIHQFEPCRAYLLIHNSGLNLTTDGIIPAHTNRLNWNTPLPRTAFLWTKTLYKSLKFLFCIHKVVRRILTIRCWPADSYKLYPLYPTSLFNSLFNSTRCFPCVVFRAKQPCALRSFATK